MNVIFCHSYDQDAIWLYLELKKQGEPVHLLAPEQVLMAREWTQHLSDGDDGFVVTIHNGITIRSGEVDFFFNRAQYADAPVWQRAPIVEREYVRAEMTAMLMSWLHQIQQECLMINPPFGQSFCGAGWNDTQWAKAAFEAGFQNIMSENPYNESEKILVVGSEVISGAKSRAVTTHCTRLAEIAQSPLIEVIVRDNGNTFVSATTKPAFRTYGNKFLSLLQKHLTGETP